MQTIWEIKGHEENAYERRPNGAEIHDSGPEAKNWLEQVSTIKLETLTYQTRAQTACLHSARRKSLLKSPILPFLLLVVVRTVS
jgi:hypothetical protein